MQGSPGQFSVGTTKGPLDQIDLLHIHAGGGWELIENYLQSWEIL